MPRDVTALKNTATAVLTVDADFARLMGDAADVLRAS
jgi:hypothetical protein